MEERKRRLSAVLRVNAVRRDWIWVEGQLGVSMQMERASTHAFESWAATGVLAEVEGFQRGVVFL